MACLDFPWLHWIKSLLPNSQGRNRDRPYSPAFSWGEDINLECQSPAALHDISGATNPDREVGVIKPRALTPFSASHSDNDIIVLPYPVSYNTTPPLRSLLDEGN